MRGKRYPEAFKTQAAEMIKAAHALVINSQAFPSQPLPYTTIT